MKNDKSNKAWALIRISSLAQKDNNSFENQRQHIKSYAEQAKLDLVHIEEIVESASGKKDRKQYKAFMRNFLNKKIKNLIFYTNDRESRNLTDYEENERLVRSGEMILHYALDKKVFDIKTPDSDFLNRDFMGVMSTHYSRDLSTKVKNGSRVKAESGWSPICVPPLGYIHQKLKNAHGFEKQKGTILIVDPNLKNVEQVKREFELRSQNPTPSLEQIRRVIIAEGYLSPDRIKKYHVAAIEKRLKNIFYNGRFIWSGKEYVGKHQCFIDNTTFQKVQDSFGQRNPYGKKGVGVFRNGWLKCSKDGCGCHIIYDPRKKLIKSTGNEKLYKHYRCTNGKKAHQDTKGLRVEEAEILSQFGSVIDLISIPEAFAKQILDQINNNQLQRIEKMKKEMESLKLSLPLYEKKLMKLYDDYSAGVIDQNDYLNFSKNTKSEKEICLTQVANLERNIGNVKLETVESTLQLAKDAKRLWENRSDAEKVKLLEVILSNQRLNGVTVEYILKKPFYILSEMSRDLNWRRRWDLNPRNLFCKFESLAKTWFQPLTHFSASKNGIY